MDAPTLTPPAPVSDCSSTPPPLLAGATSKTGAVLFIVAGLLAVIWLASVRNGLLYLVGVGLGVTLVASGLGFTGSWRNFIVHRRAQGMLATLVLLALATLIFIPTLAVLDNAVGSLAPVALSVVIGAVIFGIGMQLGNGCGSGTLAGAGSGSPHAILVLLAFLPGSLLGTWHLPWWLSLPNAGQVPLTKYLGTTPTILLQLLAFASIAAVVVHLARKHNATLPWLPSRRQLTGCVVLVAFATLALYISGQMWSITFGHALWGAKVATLAGLPVAQMEFWTYPYPAAALTQPLLADITSVMNLGLLAGVAFVTLWNNKNLKVNINKKQVFAAVLGGLLMGYGARLSFGCNIGALFSGTASGSLHAWVWFAAAWIGCHFGIRLRPRFGLVN